MDTYVTVKVNTDCSVGVFNTALVLIESCLLEPDTISPYFQMPVGIVHFKSLGLNKSCHIGKNIVTSTVCLCLMYHTNIYPSFSSSVYSRKPLCLLV